MLPTIFDELEARGEAKGRAEGKVEGEAKGKAQSILQLLKSRFRTPSASVEKKLLKITDIEYLTVLFERAIYCESLKAFSDSLK